MFELVGLTPALEKKLEAAVPHRRVTCTLALLLQSQQSEAGPDSQRFKRLGTLFVRRRFQSLTRNSRTSIPHLNGRQGMHSPMATMKRFLFRVIARTAIGLYSYLPIFGYLRASVAVLRKGDLILVIDRNDGRGFSFPGGLARRGETAEQTMRREVHEETGLIVGKSNFLFDYRSRADIPCLISVFEAEVEWESGRVLGGIASLALRPPRSDPVSCPVSWR